MVMRTPPKWVCQDVKKQNLIALYIAEQLPPARSEAFEKHYLECKQCFDALELMHAAAIGLAGIDQAASFRSEDCCHAQSRHSMRVRQGFGCRHRTA
jgi:hypothetical protein